MRKHNPARAALSRAVNAAIANGAPIVTEQAPQWFLEYDWSFNVYRPRMGGTFTDIRGARSYATMKEAKAALAAIGWRIGRKTDTRTWAIETN